MDRQCSSCGGFCKKSGCERENTKPKREWVYAGNGTAGRENMTAPTGFWIKHNDKASQGEEHMNDQITEFKKKCWDNQTERLDVEKLAKLLLEDVMSICEDLGDKGMDGHYCVDAIAKKFGLKEKNT